MRIILYTGKGGVGKTSVAAATACKIAENGKKVLVISTDQAHSLGDALEQKLGNRPVNITKNLSAMEIDVVEESEKAWGSMQEYIKRLLLLRAEGGIEAEELLVFPGLEELFSLLSILDIYEKAEYDVLIVDCAPTGETMSLLKFPEMIGNWVEKVLPMKRKAVKTVGPAVEKLAGIPMPKDQIFDEVEMLMERLKKLRDLMSQKEVVSIRIVTTPEKIVVREAKRNFSYLHLYDYNVDAVIVNRIYPQQAMEGYFAKWMVRQEESLVDIRESFREIPVFCLQLQKSEVKGISILSEVARELYGNADPEPVLFAATIFEVEKEGEEYCMKVHIPFVDKNEMELLKNGDELVLSIKNEKRRFCLPDTLRGRQLAGARYAEDALQIRFRD